jgi:acyl-coenzyme A thioesterase PaaI-like protein
VTRVVLPVVETGPEALFRLGEITASEDGVYGGSMAVGPELTVVGRTPAGVLAVLVDDVLGFAIVEDVPSGRWSVSAEIAMDVLAPLPTTGTLHVEARLDHVDGLGGLSTGRVTTGDGALVALCRQRGRFVAAPPDLVEEGSWGAPVAAGDLERLLAIRDGVPLRATDVLANEGGSLHGGISMFASELVAAAVAPDLVTASVHITYTRVIPLGTEVTWRTDVVHRGRTLTVVDVQGLVEDRVCTSARVVLHPPA